MFINFPKEFCPLYYSVYVQLSCSKQKKHVLAGSMAMHYVLLKLIAMTSQVQVSQIIVSIRLCSSDVDLMTESIALSTCL